jgi:uncharacterized protein with GYD domain
MPTFVMLGHFSDQGIRNIKDTPKRSDAFKTARRKRQRTLLDYGPL